MKTNNNQAVFHTALTVAVLFSLNLLLPAAAQGPPNLELRVQNNRLELRWPARMDSPTGAIAPVFEVQVSADLKRWRAAGPRVDGQRLAAGSMCVLSLTADSPQAFYRLLAVNPTESAGVAVSGENVFGFGEAFAQELAAIGQITPAEFAARYSLEIEYVPCISSDPTAARFWDLFSADPAVLNRGLPEDDPLYRRNDYRLNDAELAIFRQNGFVVSERLGAYSYADAFYKIWEDDLPVFISTDAILQAWHRSFDMMLMELEDRFLSDCLERMLAAMASKLPEAAAQAASDFPRECLADADYYLAVARSLLAGTNVSPSLGVDLRVAETLEWVKDENLRQVDSFLGSCRVIDFSQFKPRGHYTESERLMRYFQAMMWCGRIDLAVAGGPFARCQGTETYANPREMGTAIVLWHLLNQSGEFATWQAMDRVIQAFVGWTDSMTFAQLGDVLGAAGIQSLADVPNLNAIEVLQAAVLSGDAGVQLIRSDYFVSLLEAAQIQLPRSFTVLGQKFVPDSWAMAKTVYDDILWVENGFTNKVPRRVPSGLDVAFSVLGNDQVVPELVARMTDPNARQSTNHSVYFRDGLPYQHNLAAVRDVIDQMTPAAWQESLYVAWLATLRELSVPTASPMFPEVMRTHAWAMKTLNTQLASWSQLRHDTLLYAKQSYSGVGCCYFPDGYVEPRPAFWAAMRQMLLRTSNLIGELPMGANAALLRENLLVFLSRFANALRMLQQMAEAELAGRPFTEEEQLFIRNLLEHVGWGAAGSQSVRVYNGWYPQLFYRPLAFWGDNGDFFDLVYGCDKWDIVIADVHTDLPSPDVLDPGGVLHEGVGNVNLLLLTVPTPAGPAVFAGPVLSHFEFELVGSPTRLSDQEWAWDWEWADEGVWYSVPAPPEWTGSFLVPCQR